MFGDNGCRPSTYRENEMSQLKRFIIEREIPGIGSKSLVDLCGAARDSNHAIYQIVADQQ